MIQLSSLATRSQVFCMIVRLFSNAVPVKSGAIFKAVTVAEEILVTISCPAVPSATNVKGEPDTEMVASVIAAPGVIFKIWLEEGR